jgi:streptogramin lyase
MKVYISLLSLMLLVTGISCKKDYPTHYPPSTPPKGQKAIVTTIAGSGEPRLANGPALTAQFHLPSDVTVMPDGTIYITDLFNSAIRKLAGGQVTTVAGNGNFDIVNGNGAAARFKDPFNITFDAAGNLYTSDANDSRIRKITPAGDVTTFAGTETEGFTDGDLNTALFHKRSSLVTDADGNMFLSDDNRIRKISPAGVVTTIPTNANFLFLSGIAVDKQGNLYVVDAHHFRIAKITPDGNISTVAGSGEPGDKNGNATEAQFREPRDIVIDSHGNIFVSDANRIRMITPQGVVSTIGGAAGFKDGNATVAQFDLPAGLGIDKQDNIYVADLTNNRIRKISFE